MTRGRSAQPSGLWLVMLSMHMRVVAVRFTIWVLAALAFGAAAPAQAQLSSCAGGAIGMCTCPDGITIAAGIGQCPGGAVSAPPVLPRCSAGSVSAAPCVCSDGRLSGAGGTCAEHACPAGQIRVGDNCRCVQRGFVADAATGICGCPAGTVMSAGQNGPACIKR